MSKKTTALALTNWWVRAALSFVVGILFAVLTEMMYGTYFSFLTGVTAFMLTIVAPIVFSVQAIKHEKNWRS